jgi:hypothetical protein
MHIVPSHCLRKIYIPHYVRHYFWPKLLQDQTRYMLKFIFNSLISCDAFQSFYLLLFVMWHFDWFIIKKNYPPSPNPKLKITQFYIISHECAKLGKVFIFALTLEWFYKTQHGLTLVFFSSIF